MKVTTEFSKFTLQKNFLFYDINSSYSFEHSDLRKTHFPNQWVIVKIKPNNNFLMLCEAINISANQASSMITRHTTTSVYPKSINVP